ncbi:RelA/SpoT domain-containing protein [bacterium]|nr:RelA/SpoT domain-containing protein [bacterium]
MNIDQKVITQLWREEQPLYKEFGKVLKTQISKLLSKEGIPARITHRPKEIGSLLKKILRKRYTHPYEDIGDKLGVRIVVRFRSDLEKIDEILQSNFKIVERDNKSEKLELNRIGYQAIHYQAELKSAKKEMEIYGHLEFEIQLRTLCQDVWSEIYHSLAYKNEENLPKPLLRKMHCLSAIFEIADVNFADIEEMIQESSETSILGVVSLLEKMYFKIQCVAYDRELTIMMVKNLIELYNESEKPEMTKIFHGYFEQSQQELKNIISSEGKTPIFFSQPEIIMILERLEKDPYSLSDKWDTFMNHEMLENIATKWGKSLD